MEGRGERGTMNIESEGMRQSTRGRPTARTNRLHVGLVCAIALLLPLSAGIAPIAAQATTAPDGTGEAAAGSGTPDATGPAVAPEGMPAREAAVVDRLQRGLLDILARGGSLHTEQGIRELGALVAQTFDIDAMGAAAVGVTTFGKWSPWQRETFLEAFTRFMVATHASRFEKAPDQSFSIDAVEPAQRGRRLVAATYTRAGREPVAVDYLVQDTAAGWRILDVYLEGEVSLLALHRAEFASVLRNKGYDGFIAAMNAKAAELETRAVN